MINPQRKFLVIGAGLSGVCVSLQLIRRGANVTLIDSGVNVSSIVAAGMINPLVFRRMTKSWRVDEFIPYLKSFYSEIQKETGTAFFHELPVRRLFSSDQEKEFWLERQLTEEFMSYMHPLTTEDKNYSRVKNEFGSARLKETYYVDVIPFFNAAKNQIKLSGAIIEEEFEVNQLSQTTYKGEVFDDIIFCQGYLNDKNPWFNFVPIDQTKGQTLTIKSAEIPEDVSLNRKCFVFPKGKNEFRIGATYEWNNPTTHVTPEGRKELLDHLSFITDEKVDVINQEAGIRPTTRDRRPALGTHTDFIHYHIFNGLGAKGYMLAPLLSKEFVDYLYNEFELDKEVNILRFLKKK